jgi:hypothetical protein
VTRENSRAKAQRLLWEGRVAVHSLEPGRVVASVKGDSASIYTVKLVAGYWSCTCVAAPVRIPRLFSSSRLQRRGLSSLSCSPDRRSIVRGARRGAGSGRALTAFELERAICTGGAPGIFGIPPKRRRTRAHKNCPFAIRTSHGRKSAGS